MILDELAKYSKYRVEEAKKKLDLEEIKKKAESKVKGEHNFFKALSKEGLNFICEIKKASPSKGIIAEKFDYLSIAKEYEKAGASAVSVLTEPKWFLGSNEIFKEVRNVLGLPMLRKDFTVDEYQIYEAKLLGADAILIIVSITSLENIKKYLEICENLGLDALVETHNEEEIEIALEAGAKIIGVNNRNLKDFSINFDNAKKLREKVPKNIIYVVESGLKDKNDIRDIINLDANAVLIGEAIMRAENKEAFIKDLKNL